MKLTLYQVLGTEPDASAEEIGAAHERALAAFQQGTQDRNQGILLRDAFEVLSDPLKRSRYDASLRPREAPQFEFPPAKGRRRIWPTLFGAGILVLAGGSLWWLAKRPPLNKPATPASAQVAAVAQPAAPAAKPAPAPAAVRSAEELYAQLSASVARIDVFDQMGRQVGSGSGVAIGLTALITNCHVAKAGARLKVKIRDQLLDASIAIADEELDLCRLEVPGMAADAVVIGNSADMRIGQKVYALGSPRGLDLTISDGIVSSLRLSDKGTLIQTTAPVSPGSSGGGLFDTSGRLVGIVTFQLVNGQNLNFAAPAEWIADMSTRSGNGLIGKRELAD